MKRLVRDPWFGNKRFGWGLTPVRWEGWVATAAFLVVIYLTLRATLRLGPGYPVVAMVLGTLELLAFVALTILTSVWLEPR